MSVQNNMKDVFTKRSYENVLCFGGVLHISSTRKQKAEKHELCLSFDTNNISHFFALFTHTYRFINDIFLSVWAFCLHFSQFGQIFKKKTKKKNLQSGDLSKHWILWKKETDFKNISVWKNIYIHVNKPLVNIFNLLTVKVQTPAPVPLMSCLCHFYRSAKAVLRARLSSPRRTSPCARNMPTLSKYEPLLVTLPQIGGTEVEGHAENKQTNKHKTERLFYKLLIFLIC